MIRIRDYRNQDSPGLLGLWNRTLPARAVAKPLDVHELDALIMGKLGFEAEGLRVAEIDGRIVGFAHAGFGPLEPGGPSHQLDFALGTIAMLTYDPDATDTGVGLELVRSAEDYLRSRGATVLYAGGQWPLNPFYWGIYGGSESPGVLDTHVSFRAAVESAGYQPAAHTILLELEAARASEGRDPRSVLIRRQTRLQIIDDAASAQWWESLALGHARITSFELRDRLSDTLLARGACWEMAGFERGDGASRTGLMHLEVEPAHRRHGFGRYLVGEVMRAGQAAGAEILVAQTSAENAPALALYESLGFRRVDTATLYRKPAT